MANLHWKRSRGHLEVIQKVYLHLQWTDKPLCFMTCHFMISLPKYLDLDFPSFFFGYERVKSLDTCSHSGIKVGRMMPNFCVSLKLFKIGSLTWKNQLRSAFSKLQNPLKFAGQVWQMKECAESNQENKMKE